MLHDRLGNRIEAGCILYDAAYSSMRVVLGIELKASAPSPDWDVVCFVFEVGRSYWSIGRRPVIGLSASSHYLRKAEVVGNIHASVCNGEHDFAEDLDRVRGSVSVCLRCGLERHNTPPLS